LLREGIDGVDNKGGPGDSGASPLYFGDFLIFHEYSEVCGPDYAMAANPRGRQDGRGDTSGECPLAHTSNGGGLGEAEGTIISAFGRVDHSGLHSEMSASLIPPLIRRVRQGQGARRPMRHMPRGVRANAAVVTSPAAITVP